MSLFDENNPVKIVMADDHEVVLEGLQMLLNLENDIEVIGEVRTGREAVKMTQKLHPNVFAAGCVATSPAGRARCPHRAAGDGGAWIGPAAR